MVDQRYLVIKEHNEGGFKPCVDYGEWRVAILRYDSDVDAENINYLERHNQTDEVFVLLKGRCILFVGEISGESIQIQGINMDPEKLYNIKKGTYHHHALSEEAVVLIVENRDTGSQNSDRIPLTTKQKYQITAYQNSFWGK